MLSSAAFAIITLSLSMLLSLRRHFLRYATLMMITYATFLHATMFSINTS